MPAKPTPPTISKPSLSRHKPSSGGDWPFKGTYEFVVTTTALGATFEHRMRATYVLVPPWAYYDPIARRVVEEDEARFQSITSFDVWDRAKRRWVKWEVSDEWDFSRAFYDALDDAIDADCRKVDAERRARLARPAANRKPPAKKRRN